MCTAVVQSIKQYKPRQIEVLNMVLNSHRLCYIVKTNLLVFIRKTW